MKKLSVILLAICFALGMAYTAQAANLVEVKTTTDPIQLFPCEKSGSITFDFDEGSTLTTGDWWTVTLPFGVTLCSTIDIELSSGNGGPIFTNGSPPGSFGAVTYGPVAAPPLIGSPGQGIYFRVFGLAGTQVVTISVLGTAPGAFVTIPVVPALDATITVKLFDSAIYGPIAPFSAPIWEDTDGDGTYGDDKTPGNGDFIEPIDNTMCIDARSITGNCVEVSYDSILDKFTFTGDNVVACRVSGADIVCTGCKGVPDGDVLIAGGQLGGCSFTYETGAGYCPTFSAAGTTSVWPGNRVIIQRNTPGMFTTDPTADYMLEAEIVSPAAGVYFGGAAMTAWGGNITTCDLTQCALPCTGTAIAIGGTSAFDSGGALVTTFDGGTCAVTATQRAVRIATSNITGFVGLNMYNQLWAFLPPFVYDTSLVSDGDVVTVQITLTDLPCTTIHQCDVDVATLVVACATAPAGAYMMTMPYFPAANDATWWSGAALSNCSATDAGCTLTFYEFDGDAGTWSATIAGNGMWVDLWSNAFSSVTQTGGTGSLGDSAFFVCISCTGGTVRSFAMLGDGSQGQGMAIGPTCP
jgi:hypothetical protein